MLECGRDQSDVCTYDTNCASEDSAFWSCVYQYCSVSFGEPDCAYFGP